MTLPYNDEGTIEAIILHMIMHILPEALAIQKKLNNNQRLNDIDVAHLNNFLIYTRKVLPNIQRHPDYGHFISKLILLHKEMIEQSLEKEKLRPDHRSHLTG